MGIAAHPCSRRPISGRRRQSLSHRRPPDFSPTVLVPVMAGEGVFRWRALRLQVGRGRQARCVVIRMYRLMVSNCLRLSTVVRAAFASKTFVAKETAGHRACGSVL